MPSSSIRDVALRILDKIVDIAGSSPDGRADFSSVRGLVGATEGVWTQAISYLEQKAFILRPEPTALQPTAAGIDAASASDNPRGQGRNVAGPDRKRVFVVHGRNLRARNAVFQFLRTIGLRPIEWEQAIRLTGEASPYIGDVLDAAFTEASAAIIVLTPDDIAYLRHEYADGPEDPEARPTAQARPNVLFEAGMAFGRHPRRTVLVEFGKVRPFSDVTGRHVVRLDNSAEQRKALASRLEAAGCAVEVHGDGWLNEGDLNPPLPPGDKAPLGRRLPSPSSRAQAVDAEYHGNDQGDGRIRITNRGPAPLYNVGISLPPEVKESLLVIDDNLPIKKLPPGKTATILAVRTMGPGSDHFELSITGETEDGEPIDAQAFINLLE